jgi:hypothetical protein
MVFASILAVAAFALFVFACVQLARAEYRGHHISRARTLAEALPYYDRRKTPRGPSR